MRALCGEIFFHHYSPLILHYYDLKRNIGEVLFLIYFIGVIFEAGNETREKIWSDFGAEQKLRAEQKKWFLCTPLFLREREKLMCKKIFSKRAKLFCSRAAFKSSFLQLLRFDYDIVLILGLF